jgi:NAD(P) transhydrogenase subunit beta
LQYLHLGAEATTAEVIFTVFTVIVGCVSFSGSIITFLKLQELMTTRPVVFPAGRFVIAATLVSVVGVGGWVVSALGTSPLLILAGLSLLFGVLFVLPVGGADVPIVISLLNAFTGLTVAASGYVLNSTLLIIAGTLVGASGTILTRLMAEAMGRSLFGTLFGAFTAKPQDAASAGEERPVRSVFTR